MTREDVRRIAEHILLHPVGSSVGENSAPPSLNKSNSKYWEQAQWQAIRNKVKAKELCLDSPIISLYMEDESGQPISAGVKNTLRGDLISYWNEIRASGEELTNFTDLGLERKDHFRKTFEDKYPWLRLCEAHWKVDHLWINYFGSWKKSRNTPEPTTVTDPRQQSTDPKRSETLPGPTPAPIQEPSPETSGASVGSKRGREEPGDLYRTSKRYKGKDKAIFTPTKFYNSRPKGKIQATLAKVSDFPVSLNRIPLRTPQNPL